jgi:hypothetical protein
VRVGADQRVGIRPGSVVAVADEHHPGQVLQVHLVADTGIGRDHGEIGERFLRPTQQLVTLRVAVELQPGVDRERVGPTERVDDHRVVDDQL